MKSVYLASPYSYKSKIPGLAWLIRWCRYRTITKIAAILTELQSVALILPITQSYHMSKYMSCRDTGFSAWADIDLTFVSIVEEVWVIKMDGWKESIGVQAEIAYALSINKPVRYFDPTTLEEQSNY